MLGITYLRRPASSHRASHLRASLSLLPWREQQIFSHALWQAGFDFTCSFFPEAERREKRKRDALMKKKAFDSFLPSLATGLAAT